ncbi:DUF1266 domain-containing protein [Streptomyces sp. NPDC052396]|uniref:DUF1266 domain-containing protein n=1 Tax=Streptomyces sp. NPDC052396 TaxID=3365689 RepID=UPI0037D801B5
MDAVAEDELHDEIFPDIPAPEDGGPWQAPAELEQHLYELGRSGDVLGYLRAVAAEGVYYPVLLEEARAAGEDEYPMLLVDVPDGRTVAQVYTSGVLPRPHPQLVYEYATLGALARILPGHVDVLFINAGTPCEQFFQTDDGERQAWLGLHDDHFSPEELMDRTVTHRTGAPAALLHGLACGAHLCHGNGDAWNTVHWHGMGYRGEVQRLADYWGVASREDWLGVQERLLNREVSPWHWDFVLGGRGTLARERGGGRVDPALWRDWVETTLRANVEVPENDPEFEAFVVELRDLVGKVLRYEARFRADGLLPPDGRVDTIAAWDIGRASKMARWGRGARYATEPEMHTAIERASRTARDAYGSWAEFSAGYVLGRCLHFDEEEFGPWYTDVLEAHRSLATDPDGPWLTVPFAAE